ncbi:MAG: spore germination protein [Tissierellaceae bacterium]|nr:spore germination protein [Tissierellaceae bacterium]
MILLISKDLHENKQELLKQFNYSSDITIHEIETLCNTQAMVCYINGFIDKEALNENILKPLIKDLVSPMDITDTVYISAIKEVSRFSEVISEIIDGHVALFHEDLEKAFVLNLCKYEKRSVSISDSEQVIRGPKEAFIEDLFVNKTLIRRIIRNKNLVFEDFVLGDETNTKVSIVYVKEIVNEEILAELNARIKEIKTDVVLDSNYIEEYIDDAPKSLLPTVYNTERPDVLAGKILEGRIGIICDGSPNALTVPKLFVECLMTAEDYYLKPLYATFLRFIRVFSLFVSITLVGIYIALSSFHQEMIPTPLLISMAGQREGVPLSSFLEAVFMILFFEIMKEAGLRLPKAIGQTVTLIGGLVIGQAAVEAGVISAIMVIVVSATGIAEFVNPTLRDFIIINRIFLIILGSIFGIYGIVCGIIIYTYHLASIKSIGVPYLFPMAPYDKEGMKDVFKRSPIKEFKYRPKYISSNNSRKRNKRA